MNLLELIEHSVRSGFYGSRVGAAGGFEDLAPTHRHELLADQLAQPPHGSRRPPDSSPPVRAGTTGSGADLLVLTYTAADLARERRAGAALFGTLGLSAGMRVANALAGALTTPGSLLLGDVIEEMGCLDVPVGFPTDVAAARQAWTLLDRVQPDVLVLDRSGAETLIATVPGGRREWLRGVIWLRRGGAEDPPLPLPEGLGFSGWQRQWLAIAEASSFVAGSCAEGRFHPEAQMICEVIDANGHIRPTGKGRLLLTPLRVETALLRYDSGITTELSDGPCLCGTSGLLLTGPLSRIPAGEG